MIEARDISTELIYCDGSWSTNINIYLQASKSSEKKVHKMCTFCPLIYLRYPGTDTPYRYEILFAIRKVNLASCHTCIDNVVRSFISGV